MLRSENIQEIAKAICKAQTNIGSAKKDNSNPYFKSKYADLGQVLAVCKDALNAEGISILQPTGIDTDGKPVVETYLMHTSGQYIGCCMPLTLDKNNMQGFGSAVSYARRYSLQSLLSIPAEDDDGNRACTVPARREIKSQQPLVVKINNAQAVELEKFGRMLDFTRKDLTRICEEYFKCRVSELQPHLIEEFKKKLEIEAKKINDIKKG